jgi:hypothetical protein
MARRGEAEGSTGPTDISMNPEELMWKKGGMGLTGHGTSQQGLAGAGRAEQQHAFGDPGAALLILRGLPQERAQLCFPRQVLMLGVQAPSTV